MTIAFTICSNNYLALSKTLFDSLAIHHPEMKTFIFLVDELNEQVDYGLFSPAEVLVVDQKVVPAYKEMIERYSVIELNSAIRPFIIQWLAGRYPDCDRLYYLDPDMYVYDRLDHLDKLLEQYDILLTTHFLKPIPIDGLTPFENLALNYGVYNLGFLALNPATGNVKKFLAWWGERTRQFGNIDLVNGYFVDQIWFNLVPLFFEKVHTLTHPGYNMAFWNLHERVITHYAGDGRIVLNSGEYLAIYHFSSWDFFKPKELSQKFTRFRFDNRQDLVKLFDDYCLRLQKNGMDMLSRIPCRLPYKKLKGRSSLKKLLVPGVDMMKKVWKKI